MNASSEDADSAAGDATDESSSVPPGHPADQRPTTDEAETASSSAGRWRTREVEVPMRVYKTVTVFATLIAVVSVLGGFVLLDLATDRAQRPLSDVDALVALLGIAAIVFGAVTYAYSTRFRARGMGKPNTGDGQGDDDG